MDQIFSQVDTNNDGHIDYGVATILLSSAILALIATVVRAEEFTTFLRENPEYMQLISFRIAEGKTDENTGDSALDTASDDGQNKNA